MLPELEALLELQRRDSRLLEAKRRKDELPRRREALRGALTAAKGALEKPSPEPLGLFERDASS